MILVVSSTVKSIKSWCNEHNFDFEKDIRYITGVADTGSLYSFEVESVVFLSAFYNLPASQRNIIFERIVQKMRLRVL